jgi:serpin B
MRWSKPLAALALVSTLAGCESIFGSGDEEPITGLPRALTQSEQNLIVASNRFGFNLLREVSARDTSSNVFLSPLSASMALGMTMNGARGETFTGMRSTLGFGTMEPAEINASYRSLIDLLLGLDRNVDMRLANSIWVDQQFPLHPAFVESSLQHFDARVTPLDFGNPASVKTINAWVDQGTNGKIKTILESIDAGVVMYLINAVYFKGSWTREFDPARTSPAPFHRADGGQHSVQMMFMRDAKVRGVMNDQVQMVDLAYGRGAFSMTLVLPPGGQPLRQWAAGVTDEKWQTWVGQLRDAKMDVLLPRFRLEYDEVLNNTLKALGMGTAFDDLAADFSGMSPLGADLFITNVKQKTFIEVNEKGTEAAAATSVEMGVTSGPPTFHANRPFLVAIRERHSGTILFVGLIGDPRSQ